MKKLCLIAVLFALATACPGASVGSSMPIPELNDCASNDDADITVAIDQSSPVIGCGAAVTLTATVSGAAELSWLRNGEFIDGATTSTFIANQSGTYTVFAVALTCQAQSAPVEVIIESPLNATILLPTGNEACLGEQLELQAAGGNAQWQWYRNDVAINGANGPNYFAGETGTYTVVGNATSPCASTSVPVEVVIHSLPQVTIFWEGNPTICAGDSVSLTAALAAQDEIAWYYNGLPALGNEVVFNATIAGQYSAVATNPSTGCSNESNSLTLDVFPTQSIAIAAVGNTAFCDGQSLVLELLTAFDDVQWQANGQDVEGATSSVLQITSAASYSAQVIDANGCASSSNELNVEVYPLPNTALSIEGNGAAVLCGEGDLLTAQAEPGDTYVWYAADEEVMGEVASSFAIDQPGEYAVQITNAFGCVAISEPLFVEQYGLPELSLEPSGLVTLCVGQTQYIEAICSTAVQYEWYADGVLLNDEFNGYFEASEGGEYTVRVMDENGCEVVSSPAILQALVVETPSISDGGITAEGQLLLAPVASGNQWYFNGEAISGATQSSYMATTSGVYTVISIEDVCESALSEGFSVNISGIEEQDRRISLYPNPCSDFVVLEGMLASGSSYSVYDTCGRIVLEGVASGARVRIETSALGSGIYHVVLADGLHAAFEVLGF
jgi:hypothetical protein